jgi:hypothetical protein
VEERSAREQSLSEEVNTTMDELSGLEKKAEESDAREQSRLDELA